MTPILRQSERHTFNAFPIVSVPALLDPMTDETCFVLTSAGEAVFATQDSAGSQAQREEASVAQSPTICPCCSARMDIVNLYVGDRNYAQDASCTACDYYRRAIR